MIPCENCLLIPVCRHKEYRVMLHECMPLVTLLYIQNENVYSRHKENVTWPRVDSNLRHPNFNELIKKVESRVVPSLWRVVNVTPTFVSIKDK